MERRNDEKVKENTEGDSGGERTAATTPPKRRRRGKAKEEGEKSGGLPQIESRLTCWPSSSKAGKPWKNSTYSAQKSAENKITR